jgi:two-component system NtrC family sensor kinase
LTNTKGQRVGTVGVCRDITRWKKLQDDLVRVDRLAETGRIASGIAHEINNPIAVISEVIGWAGEVIEEAESLNADDRAELLEVVKRINEQTRRCRSITHQLLGFVRESAPDKSEFEIHELLKGTVGFLKPELKLSPIEIVYDFYDGPLRMTSDPRMMEQLFVNLLSNAVYAVREKGQDDGRIEIRTRKNNSDVEINIQDNGTGIHKNKQEKIFSLFFTTKPPGKGTGLGLAICQNIVKNLGGSLSFSSEFGVGTSFAVQFPLS